MNSTTSPTHNANPSQPAFADLSGKRVVVMGLGRFGGGIGVTRWLAQSGAGVIVTDAADESALRESIAALSDLPIQYQLGGHEPSILDDADLVVVNPAVDKRKSAFFKAIADRGLEWTTEINLFMDRCPARIIGVTGTAGKSTTAAMIHHVLDDADMPHRAFLGGNIGRSLLGELDAMTPDDWVVLELSSTQLADITRIVRRPDIAVIVTLWPHHIDRHASFDEYVDSKFNIARHAREKTPVVVGFNGGSLHAGLAALAEHFHLCVHTIDRSTPPSDLRVPGAHNQHNARCAAKACQHVGIDETTVRTRLESFTGLPHRIQHVGVVNGVQYYNDSKSTCPRTTRAAMSAMHAPFILLLGGARTNTSIDELTAHVLRSARAVVCFGAKKDTLMQALTQEMRRQAIDIPVIVAANVSDAVRRAHALAKPGDAVLFSPGFASFDEFPNYQARGDAFTACVHAADSNDRPSD